MGGKEKKKKPLDYRERDYRGGIAAVGLVATRVVVRETDLFILAPRAVETEARGLIIQARAGLEAYIEANPRFLPALSPLKADPLAPPLVREMLAAASAAGVGPMAAVAGAVAEAVGRGLLALDGIDEVVVENGGDTFISRRDRSIAAIYAGDSPFSNRVGIKLASGDMPVAVCTSSATIGHSLSLGRADAVTVVAPAAAMADAAATRIANETGSVDDMEKVLDIAAAIPDITGTVIIINDRIGVRGDIELTGL